MVIGLGGGGVVAKNKTREQARKDEQDRKKKRQKHKKYEKNGAFSSATCLSLKLVV